jgi:hypothetical protein
MESADSTESTPRPTIDVKNLEPYPWPDIEWKRILSPAVNVVINAYRLKQRKLYKWYYITEDDDDLSDPDPFQPYYVFFIQRFQHAERFQPRVVDTPNGPAVDPDSDDRRFNDYASQLRDELGSGDDYQPGV